MDTSPYAYTPRPKLIKMIFRAGDIDLVSWGTLREIFYAIFLMDVGAIKVRLASAAVLFTMIRDALTVSAESLCILSGRCQVVSKLSIHFKESSCP